MWLREWRSRVDSLNKKVFPSLLIRFSPLFKSRHVSLLSCSIWTFSHPGFHPSDISRTEGHSALSTFYGDVLQYCHPNPWNCSYILGMKLNSTSFLFDLERRWVGEDLFFINISLLCFVPRKRALRVSPRSEWKLCECYLMMH